MWLLKKISCEIQILNEKVGKLMIENGRLEEENKKLRDLKCVPSNLKTLIRIDKENERLEEENKKLREERDEYKERWERSFSV